MLCKTTFLTDLCLRVIDLDLSFEKSSAKYNSWFKKVLTESQAKFPSANPAHLKLIRQ